MNNTQKTIAAIAVAGTTVAIVRASHSYNQDLYERFPEIDRKVVRKAFRSMMLKSMSGQYADEMQQWSDEAMDVLFRVEVFNILARQK